VEPPDQETVSLLVDNLEEQSEIAELRVRYEWMIFDEFAVTWAVQQYFNGHIPPSLLRALLDAFTKQVADLLLLTKFNVDTSDCDLSILDVYRHTQARFQRYWSAMEANMEPSHNLINLGGVFASFLGASERDPLFYMPPLELFKARTQQLGEFLEAMNEVELVTG